MHYKGSMAVVVQEGFMYTFALFCFCRVRSLRRIIWHLCGSCPAFSFARITNTAWVRLWRERLLALITTREGISSLVWGYDAGRTPSCFNLCHDALVHWNYSSCQNISLPVLWLCRWMAWMSFVWGRPPNLLLTTADRERWALVRVMWNCRDGKKLIISFVRKYDFWWSVLCTIIIWIIRQWQLLDKCSIGYETFV